MISIDTSKIQAFPPNNLVRKIFLNRLKNLQTLSVYGKSPGNYVKKYVFYTMESPDKAKFLNYRDWQTFQFSKMLPMPQKKTKKKNKKTVDHSTLPQFCVSYLNSYLVNKSQNFLKESYRNINVALY